MKLVLYTDGSIRKGTPGWLGIGMVVQDEYGRVLEEAGNPAGYGTSNVAEYLAVIRGLLMCQRLGATDVELRSDSQLIVRQLEGRYEVKHPAMQELHSAALSLLKGLRHYTLTWIPREQNTHADRLANQGSDIALQLFREQHEPK